MAIPAAGLATVRELLSVEALRLALVAGAAGLDRPIRWAHAIELLDPRPYLRGGELVLTMGSVIRDERSSRQFVAAVMERDAGVIGFGCGNYQPSAPAALRAACEEAGLPLVEVPFEVPFIAVTEELAERMAVRRSTHDRLARRREAHLLDVLAEGGGLDGIARAIVRELRSTIVIADLEGGLEAVAGSGDSMVDVGATVKQTLAEARRGERRVVFDDGIVACDLVAVRQHRQPIGWLGWLRRSGETRPEAVEALHEAAPIVSIELTTRTQERIGNRRAIGRLLDIVRSGVADPVVLSERVMEARLDMGNLVASVWEASAIDALRHALPRSVVGEAGVRAYVISDDADYLTALAGERHLACGIGSAVGLPELGRSLVEAEAAFGVATERHAVATWRDLADLPTLLGRQSSDRLTAFANQLAVPIIEYDAKHRADLLATLRAYIDEEGGVEATARRLHVHPNSLRHRLRRIRALTGRDPFRFLDRVALYIALWAWDAEHRRMRQGSSPNIVASND